LAAEHDQLANAALAVETTPWPRPEAVSFVSRITGADDSERVTRSEATEIYVDALKPAGDRFSQLSLDARSNLLAAENLLRAADNALAAPRLTSGDVAVIESAIQALRENRQIYTSAARHIEKAGEPVDNDQLEILRDDYAAMIRSLGRSADALAERIDDDRNESYAAPAKPSVRRNLSGV
jgi:hypothetical protein